MGEAQAASFDNGCVILFVPKDVVLAACEARYYAEIDLEPGGVNHHVFFADIFGNACFELFVKVECAVQER